VAAMCRKCLRSASDEARRCPACGGHLVRFGDSGEVVEIIAGVDEPVRGPGGIPALFGDVTEQFVSVAAPASTGIAQAAPPSYAQAQAAYSPPVMPSNANGYSQAPGSMNGFSQPVAPAAVVNDQAPPPAVSMDQVLSPPLPMGYYDGLAMATAVAPTPAEKFLLPA
jgi:hypothetical protein